MASFLWTMGAGGSGEKWMDHPCMGSRVREGGEGSLGGGGVGEGEVTRTCGLARGVDSLPPLYHVCVAPHLLRSMCLRVHMDEVAKRKKEPSKQNK